MKRKVILMLLCLIFVCQAFVACAYEKPAASENSKEILTESDLAGKNVGVIAGSKSSMNTEKYTVNGTVIVPFESSANIADALDSGEIEYAILDENHAKEFVKKNASYEICSEAFGEDAVAFSMLESNKVYSIMLQKALSALKADGTIDAIVDGYLNDPEYKYDFTKPLDNGNGTFIIAIDSSMYPYVVPYDVEHDGLPYGIELAIIDAVCRYVGCDYVLQTLTTESLPGALKMEIADFAIGSYDPLNGYGENIIESAPLFTYAYVIVGKK